MRSFPGFAVTMLGYAATRVFYYAVGIRFDDTPLSYFWQYLDAAALRGDGWWRAVFCQHTQPPAFNLFLALGLHTADPRSFFAWSGVLFGLALHGGLYWAARQLGVRPWLSAVLSVALALNPASILMETWLFYTYPVAALLMLSVVLLFRAFSGQSTSALFAALSLAALVVLTRSLFHLGWFLLVVALIVGAARARRRALLVALFPLALAGSVYVKNGLVFGRPTASSWLGFSLSRLTTTRLSAPQRAALGDSLSDLAGYLPWWPLDRYPPHYRDSLRDLPAVPVLTAATRENGNPNFNHSAYLRIADVFLQDARTVLRRHPEVYWEATQRAWATHYLPIHDYAMFGRRRAEAARFLRPVERVYEGMGFAFAMAAWDWGEPLPPFEARPGWGWAWLTLGLWLMAVMMAIGQRRSRAHCVTLLYVALNIAVVAVVGNSLELGENQRFRFLSEPLTYLLLGLCIEQMLRRLHRAAGRIPRRRSARPRVSSMSSTADM